MKNLFLSLCVVSLSASSFGMEFTPVKLAVYFRGESILGEEFVVNDEKTVDYIATLKRPEQGAFKPLKYGCEAKTRLIRPSLSGGTVSPPSSSQWVEVRMVYDLKNCLPVE